jgi:flagellar biosynthesis/type III secretory pathway protein FliH
MKIFTNKQYEELINKIESEAFQKGKDAGYKQGLNEGLIKDKKGVILNSNGWYIFADDNVTDVIVKGDTE